VIYSNLLIFLTAIFLLSIDTIPDVPRVSWFGCLIVLVAGFGGYGFLAQRLFSRRMAYTSSGYFLTEKRLSILALLFFAAVLFVGDVKYYFSVFSIGGRLPVMVNIAGLGLFFIFLAIMWLAARKSYGVVFGRVYSQSSFLRANITSNLPIVIPWIVLSFVYDVLVLLPFSGLRRITESGWGDMLFFGLVLIFVMLFFPPLVRRLWGCKKLPEGPLKDHLVSFCARQNFKADIYIWSLFEGRMLTAGVMGLVPGLRYILLTPAIIETMNIYELEAVMAHEIGHVKKKHLLLYVLLIGGFSAMAGLVAEPMLYFFLSLNWVYQWMASDAMAPETIIALVGGLPLLLLLLVYFRFIFGYFIRNFERQADAYVFKVLGSSSSLVSAFEKIAGTSGQSKSKPNWHHFGIGERIEYLQRCERERGWIRQQDRKVAMSLIGYILVIAAVIGLVRQIPTEQLVRNYEGKYIELVLMQKGQNIEDKALWFRLVGDLMLNKKMEQRALVAYEKALDIAPGSPELLNNLAWLLLTSEDPSLRDPLRALNLSRTAATVNPKPHVLDTLATAFWANGLVEEAIETERQALRGDPAQADYYREQLERFRNERYSNDNKSKI